MLINRLKRLVFGSLKNQIIFGSMLFYTVFLCFFYIDITNRYEKVLAKHHKEHVVAFVHSVAAVSSRWVAENDSAPLKALMEAQKNFPELQYVSVTDVNGKILIFTENKSASGSKRLLEKSGLLEITVPVVYENRRVGFVRAGASSMMMSGNLNDVVKAGILHTLLALAAGIIMAWFLGRRYAKRLRNLMAVINRVKSGDRDARSALSGYDEAAFIGDEINNLLNSLAKSEDELRYMNKNLRMLVSKQTEELSNHLEKLRTSENELKMAQKISSTGSWTIEIQTGRIIWSDEVYSIFEIDRNLEINMPLFMERLHPEDAESVEKAWQEALKTGRYDITHRICAGERIKWVRELAEFQYDSENSPVFGLGIVQDITIHKMAEEKIAESQTRLDMALRSADMGVWSYDLTGKKRFFDDHCFRILGIDAEKFNGSSDDFMAVVHPEDADSVSEAMEKTIEQNIMYETEYRVIRPDGSVRHIAARGKLIKDNQGRSVNIYGILWDITERKLLESKIAEVQELNSRIVEISLVGIIAYEAESGICILANGFAGKIMGADEKKIKEINLHNIKSWKENGLYENALKAIDSEEPVKGYVEYTTIFGKFVCLDYVFMRFESGGKRNLLFIFEDMTEKKAAEYALKDSERKLLDLFEFLPDATFVIDTDMRVIAWNKAMERMSGVKKEDILGQGDYAYTLPFYGVRRKQMLDLIDIPDEEIAANYKNITKIGESLFAETFCPELYNKKGAYVWAVAAPLYDSSGSRVGAIESIRDITSIKETEENLARSNRELEQFAYIASHDLQEPLRKIAGFSELLKTKYKDRLDEKAETYLHYIIDGSLRMRSLINDLLEYSRLMRNQPDMVPVSVEKTVSRVIQDMELRIRETNAEICFGVLPLVLADEIRLAQLFQNLIGNALKYRGSNTPKIIISAERDGENWVISVEDNGIGISPEFYDRIFAIFQRLHTREEYPGTGIGLAVCKKIVEQFGGKIWVESVQGKGSTFYFTISAVSDI